LTLFPILVYCKIGITGDILNWLKAFLTCRRQRVVHGYQLSQVFPVLGPLLFLLYVNDISTIISHSKVKLFADDVTIYKEISSPDDVKLLQFDLSNIVQ